MSADFPLRLVSGLVLAALVLLAAWAGGLIAALAAALAAMIVHREWSGLTGAPTAVAMVFTFLVGASVVVAGTGFVLVGIGVAVASAVAAAVVRRNAWAPAGVIYAASFAIALLVLRQAAEFGLIAVIFLVAVVAMTDTGALIAGRTIGGPRLSPRISPNKTWAGAIGGIVGAVVTGWIIALATDVPESVALTLVTIVLAIACEAGDLFESYVKRRFGAKDAGNIIPGHGGLMDRVDGLVFASVAAALIGWLHGGGADIARGLLLW